LEILLKVHLLLQEYLYLLIDEVLVEKTFGVDGSHQVEEALNDDSVTLLQGKIKGDLPLNLTSVVQLKYLGEKEGHVFDV
jgi:hypothetical protein